MDKELLENLKEGSRVELKKVRIGAPFFFLEDIFWFC